MTAKEQVDAFIAQQLAIAEQNRYFAEMGAIASALAQAIHIACAPNRDRRN